MLLHMPINKESKQRWNHLLNIPHKRLKNVDIKKMLIFRHTAMPVPISRQIPK